MGNPPIQIGNFRESNELKTYGCDKLVKERTSWKYYNLGRRFWNCRNSLVESKEDLVELVSLMKKVVDLEFLVSKEKSVVDKLEKKVTKEKEIMMMLNNKLDASMQQNCMCESSGCDHSIDCCTLLPIWMEGFLEEEIKDRGIALDLCSRKSYTIMERLKGGVNMESTWNKRGCFQLAPLTCRMPDESNYALTC
uniref:Zinc finger GRF-type domain-containing protein n=1 Tax=Lactuca sativa TaxID=4236 RepID=A0A9R1XVS4_LACSA|nr:hypothetical protein LSAT_V11C100003240 [Lactuca sativa]